MEFSQTEEAEPILGPGHAFSLGPTYEDQRLRQARWWKSGLGVGRDADLGATRDQGVILKASEMKSPHLLGPAGVTSGPHHKGLRKSLVEGPLIRGHQNSPISFTRAPKQNKELASFKIREEGGRRDDQGNDFEAPSLVDDAPRYEEFNSENSPSSLISVFGRPLLFGGFLGQGGYLELNEVVDLEPLWMVAADGSEWGLESSGALVVLEEGSEGAEQQVEEAVFVASEVLGYEKWEDSCLVKFSEFLGFPTVGFKSEIMDLLRKMAVKQHQEENKGAITMSRCERELKKLVCTINYDGKNQNKVGDRERGNLMLRL